MIFGVANHIKEPKMVLDFYQSVIPNFLHLIYRIVLDLISIYLADYLCLHFLLDRWEEQTILLTLLVFLCWLNKFLTLSNHLLRCQFPLNLCALFSSLFSEWYHFLMWSEQSYQILAKDEGFYFVDQRMVLCLVVLVVALLLLENEIARGQRLVVRIHCWDLSTPWVNNGFITLPFFVEKQ